MGATTLQQPRVKFKNIALPASHGGWGFLLEPVLLGLLIAPSGAGVWLGLAALGAFLAQQPLKLAVTDRRRQRRYPRSVWAERFALLYGGVALAAFGLSVYAAQQPFWLPLLLAAPLAGVQLYFDAQNRGREFLPELAGASALGAVAAAILLAGGLSLGIALAVWGILFVRALTSIVYVRARLRLERNEKIRTIPVWVAHFAGLAGVAALAASGLAPWLAVVAVAILLGRTVVGLSTYRRAVEAKIVGFQEIGYGLLTVLLTAVGYLFNL